MLKLVADFFDDHEKADVWFRTPNPMLGNVSPDDMIAAGRNAKLRSFMIAALAENQVR